MLFPVRRPRCGSDLTGPLAAACSSTGMSHPRKPGRPGDSEAPTRRRALDDSERVALRVRCDEALLSDTHWIALCDGVRGVERSSPGAIPAVDRYHRKPALRAARPHVRRFGLQPLETGNNEVYGDARRDRVTQLLVLSAGESIAKRVPSGAEQTSEFRVAYGCCSEGEPVDRLRGSRAAEAYLPPRRGPTAGAVQRVGP